MVISKNIQISSALPSTDLNENEVKANKEHEEL